MWLPLPLDLSLHAAPALSLLLDFFLLEQSYSSYTVARGAPLTAIAFGLWYSVWVEYCASYNGTCESCAYVAYGNLLTMRIMYCSSVSILDAESSPNPHRYLQRRNDHRLLIFPGH